MKTGDKVRAKSGNKHEGRTGTVATDSEAGQSVDVEFNDQSTSWYSFEAHELETENKAD